ncbi:MAG: hypothetical protein QW704_03205, partial [Candidatus Hadarchaeales archaeon]
ISEAFGEVTATIRCLNCNNQFQKTVKNIETLKRQLLSQECSVCGEKQLQIVETKDAVREFLDLAERFNANVHFISTETEEGEQFYRGFGGIAAILRYKTA